MYPTHEGNRTGDVSPTLKDHPVLPQQVLSTRPSIRLRRRSASPRCCSAGRACTRTESASSRKPVARESRGAHVGGVEDEGRSHSVCSIHVGVCIYIPTLTLYMSGRKREKAVESEGVTY